MRHADAVVTLPHAPRPLIAIVAMGAALAAAPMAQATTPAERASAKRAAFWLAGEPPTGMPAGQQADVMVSMRITEIGRASCRERV